MPKNKGGGGAKGGAKGKGGKGGGGEGAEGGAQKEKKGGTAVKVSDPCVFSLSLM